MNKARLTRQGVRDLGGPTNGKPSSCPHYRAPDAVAILRHEELREVDGLMLLVNVYRCSACGQER